MSEWKEINDNKEWKINVYKVEFEEQLEDEARLNLPISESLGS